MAAPARITCLNLGTQTVGLAEFQKAPNGGIMLNGYRLTEILSDPNAESARLPQTRLAVSEMKNELKLKGGALNYSISGQNIFARFVKLPTIAEEKVEQIIGFEAQQNVPFPIEEVVWDYQLVGAGDNGQVEVVLVAIKADLLDDLNGATESNGFQTQIVDAAPMALYNAFRYSYSDVSGCSLLVDLGARTTNLIFIEPPKVFSRSIPIGGNTITANLAREFKEGFAQAEERKKRDGYVSLGGAYADDKDPHIARESKVIRQTMTRLHSDIARSISFYRAQQAGSAPQRIYLCGGTANMPYLREFFAEKFQLPIEFFNPLRNVTVTRNVNVEEVIRNAHQLGELVGLGLRSINNCPMELNLRPASVIKSQQLASRRPYLILASVCLVLALAGWWLYFLRAAAIQSQVLEGVDAKVAAMQKYEQQATAIKKQIEVSKVAAAPLRQVVEDRQFWPRLISEINRCQPDKYVWVTLMEPTVEGKPVGLGDPNKPLGSGIPGGTRPAAPAAGAGKAAVVGKNGSFDGIHLRGLYLSNERADRVVVDFANNLAKDSQFFDLNMKDERSVVKLRTPQDDKEWAFEYELFLKLKNPVPLP